MGLLARAVLTGFGFTLGALLLRKVAKQLGVEDPMYPTHVPPQVPPPDTAS